MEDRLRRIRTGLLHFLIAYVIIGSFFFMIEQNNAIKEPENTILKEINSYKSDYNLNITDNKVEAYNYAYQLNRDYCLSYKGLLIQLVRKGYTTEESLYAANALNIDFKENCRIKAQSYQFSNNMSEIALRGCLTSDYFTNEEIDYAISFIDF